jgi:hypothetical protein
MILPLPSASSADSSRFRKRLAPPKQAQGETGRLQAIDAGGRQVDELRVRHEGAAAGHRLPRRLAYALVLPPMAARCPLPPRKSRAPGPPPGADRKTQARAQVAAEAVVCLDDARLDHHLPGGNVRLAISRRICSSAPARR